MKKLKLSKFNLYGTFFLKQDQIKGIEDLVQEVDDNIFLSRNANYCPSNWHQEYSYFRDICAEYARLNDLLPMAGERAFVVCEKMHELATRAVNTIQQAEQKHLFQDGENFDTVAQKCAQECADNLVRLINNEPAQKTTTKLSEETRLRPDTFFDREVVEADNKKQLYMCANALPEDMEHLITPGRGSSKLGTIVQAVRQRKGLKPLAITQIYYSYYHDTQNNQFNKLPEKLLLMDDIIFHGYTLSLLKDELTKQGHKVTSGAINASFYTDRYNDKSIFQEKDWAKYVDIIPNQYTWPFDQISINRCLKTCPQEGVRELAFLLNDTNNGDGYHTADYLAMCEAEKMAQKLGADLYQESEKISAAAVAYNKKIRTQVEAYNDELTLSY